MNEIVTYKDADAADKHGTCEGSPVFVPGLALHTVLHPDVPFVLVHAEDETEVQCGEEGERDKLKGDTSQEYLYTKNSILLSSGNLDRRLYAPLSRPLLC